MSAAITCNGQSVSMCYTYDANGNLATRTDARGVVTTYTYNELDQITSKTYNDGSPTVTCNSQAVSVCYTYNKGWLTRVNSSASTYDYTSFDDQGRVTAGTQTTGSSYPFTLDYYPFMGVKDITYPNTNRVITTGYDTAGRPATLSGQIGANTPTNYVTSIGYATHGEISSLALGNTLTEMRQYNSRLQTTQIQLGSLFTLVNRYDPSLGNDLDCNGNAIPSPGIVGNNGNVLAQTVNTTGRLYSYDGVNRLCHAVQGSTWTQSYGYDQRGNLTTTGTGQLPTATAENLIGAFGPDNRDSTWSYDRAGNVTGIPAMSGSPVRASCIANIVPAVPSGNMLRTACHDAENRMVSETDTGGATAIYIYDGDGRRVQKTAGGLTTTFVYDPLGQLAQQYGGPTIPAAELGTRYFTADHLGSTRLLTKGDGTPAENYDYLPFGQEFVSSGDTNGIRFTSKERDAETGLDYFGARYMSSAQGRFTSPDRPLVDQNERDPQSWNLYTYVGNNPLRLVDPNGLCSVKAGASAATDDPGEACVAPGDTSVTVTADVRPPAKKAAAEVVGTLLTFACAWGCVQRGNPNDSPLVRTLGPEAQPNFLQAALLGTVIGDIQFSSTAVKNAATALQGGATEVTVATKGQAEEVFLRLYQGEGYRNSTGTDGPGAKQLFGEKSGTYHWDTAEGHGPDNPHGTGPHLQIHTFEGAIVRIFYGGK
jgi:RHS repeat-associated protein